MHQCGIVAALQVDQKEAALASLQDEVKRAVEGGGETCDRVAQLQGQLEELRAGRASVSPLGGKAEVQLEALREAPALATAIATERVRPLS